MIIKKISRNHTTSIEWMNGKKKKRESQLTPLPIEKKSWVLLSKEVCVGGEVVRVRVRVYAELRSWWGVYARADVEMAVNKGKSKAKCYVMVVKVC